MRFSTRLMAMFLCLVMVFSMLPVSAMAEEPAPEEIEPAHEHDYKAVVTDPTCTEQGYTTYTCSCGDSYVDDYTDPLSHPETVTLEGYDADCSNAGLTDGLQCALCGEVLQEQEEIPAIGHQPVYVEEVPATETSTGTTAGSVCSVCGEVLEGLEEIPMLEPAPTEEPAPAVESTPTEQPQNTAPAQETAQPEAAPTAEATPAQSTDGQPAAAPFDPAKVQVYFTLTPENAELTVYAAVKGEDEETLTVALDENGEPVEIEPEEDGSYLLLPGDYLYSLHAEGFAPVEEAKLTVKRSEEPLTVEAALPMAGEKVQEEAKTVEITGEASSAEASYTGSAAYPNNSFETAELFVSEKKLYLPEALPDQSYYYIFIPEITGVYWFDSYSDDLFNIALYNDEKAQIANSIAEDEWDYGRVVQELTCGRTYYILLTAYRAPETNEYFKCAFQNDLELEAEESLIYVEAGGNATLKVTATGHDLRDLSYSWERRVINEEGAGFEAITADIPELMVENVEESLDYRCTVTDRYGNTEDATISVRLSNRFTNNSFETAEAFEVGQKLYLPDAAVGEYFYYCFTPEANGNYYFCDNRDGCFSIAIYNKDREKIASSSYLYYDAVFDDGSLLQELTAGNDYYLVLSAQRPPETDAYCTCSYENNLTVLPNKNRVCINQGETVTLSVTVTGNDLRELSYSWEDMATGELKGTSSELKVENVQKSVDYCCTVTDRYGDTDAAIIHVICADGQTGVIISSGTCGEKLTWTLDDLGTLMISGTGDMEDYSNDSSPWQGQIKHVIIEPGVTSIGAYAFYWNGFSSIVIPDSVKSIGTYAFRNCPVESAGPIGSGCNIEFGWTDAIPAGAFAYSELKSVIIPDGITAIGDKAFDGCSCLNSIVLPDSITSIGYGAFSGCKMKSLTLPEHTTSIGDHAFYSCSNLKSIIIPGQVTYIGNAAFGWCESLSSVIISCDAPDIGGQLFWGCKGLTDAGPIGSGCSVEFGWTSIPENAFENCHYLRNVRIPDGVTSIGERAFEACISLTNVVIPNSVTSIGYGAFGDCRSLTGIIVPDSVNSIGLYAFESCSDLDSVTFSRNIKSIPEGAFMRCGSLNDITIPGSVATIGNAAFAECSSLTSITIPGSVTKIGNIVFEDCTALESIHFLGRAPYHIAEDSFTNVNATAYYPVNSNWSTHLLDYGGNLTWVAVGTVPLNKPTVSSAAIVNSGVKVSWKTVTGAEKYRVLRKAGNGEWKVLAEATGTSYTDTSVSKTAKTKYSYTVQAVAGENSGKYDTKGKSVTLYAAPKMSKVANDTKAITVKWAKSSGAAKYQLYRKEGNGSFKKLGKPTTKLTYTDKSAKAGKTYTYAVQALDKNGKIISVIGAGKTIVRLTTPALKSVKATKGQVTFVWKKVTGATGYVVYRKEGSGKWKKVMTIDSGSTIRMIDKTVKKGKVYTYTVVATNGNSKSLYNTTGKKVTAK